SLLIQASFLAVCREAIEDLGAYQRRDMAKAVRIGIAGQSTGVEPSLIHPGVYRLTSTAENFPGGPNGRVAAASASLPENCSENLLYRNPLHVPAQANLRLARSTKNLTNSNPQNGARLPRPLRLTHKPPEPYI